MGPTAATESLRTGLGMGADRAVLVDDDAVAGSDLVATSLVLARVLERESPDLVLFGQQTSDGGGAVLWAAVAERLQQPFVSQATKLMVGDGVVTVDRETEVGNDRIEARLPAVVAVSDAINEPRYTSLKGMMGAKKKPLETLTAADLGLAADDGGNRGLADRRARHRYPAGARRARSRSRTTGPRRRRSSTTSQSAISYEDPRLPRTPRHGDLAGVARCAQPGRGARSPMSRAVLVGDDQLAPLAGEAGQPRRRDRVHGRRTTRSTRRCRARASTCSAELVRSQRLRHHPVLQLGARRRRRRRTGRAPRRRHQLGSRRPRSSATASRSASSRCSRIRCSPKSAGGHRNGSRCSVRVRSNRCRRRPSERLRSRRWSSPSPSTTMAATIVMARTLRTDEGPSLADADVIVAGGIGLGSDEGFDLAEQLADRPRRRGRSNPRRGLQGLVPGVGADRPDRHDGLAQALRRARDLRRGAAQGRHAELEDDRRDQQGPARADLRVQRPRGRGRRPHGRPRARRAVAQARGADVASRRLPARVSSPTEFVVGADRSRRRAHRGRGAGRRRGAPPDSPARSASGSCSRSIPTSPSDSATCRWRSSTRASRPVRICCPAR